ncbi:MAG: 3-hydroxyacyl-CoA dehydrogenase/enoyl-CoA hydratase family protein [Sediminibacterium sp.]|nr:3-hydroxyacyl-CoA dehydrogenase/enoyl-CoA hydratase family protein [Sediminibacterium sp.]
MSYSIKKVAVIGSGIMGARIACLLASVKLEIVLLDIVSPDNIESTDKNKRNAVVVSGLKKVLEANPAATFSPADKDKITIGNLTDDLALLSQCDWVIEAVVEKPEIKIELFNKIHSYLKPSVILTSNTSGIPISFLAKNLPAELAKKFCGTHFFNPPRYLKLLEIIPHEQTDKELVQFLFNFGTKILGKNSIICKDKPAFVANRILVFATLKALNLTAELGLTVDEVDAITGSVIGRPKSATFRTLDVVGLDTTYQVIKGLLKNCPNDLDLNLLKIPSFYETLLKENRLGDKTQQGFYKKIKENNQTTILSLNLETLEYQPQQKYKNEAFNQIKALDHLEERIKKMLSLNDKCGQFLQRLHMAIFSYISFRVGDICDHLYTIDEGFRSGFNIEIGLFEMWDLLGVKEIADKMRESNIEYASWIDDMLKIGQNFYQVKNGQMYYFDLSQRNYLPIDAQKDIIVLSRFEDRLVWSNNACKLVDIGDGIVGFSWQSKMNTMGAEVIQGLQKSLDIAEKKYQGMIIANQGQNFSAGANIGLIFMLAANQEYDELNDAIHQFQQTMMRIKLSTVPVFVCPHSLCLGGGVEINLHAHRVFAAAETYMGLVELGVGVIPAGGGTKEFVLRAQAETHPFEVDTNRLRTRFMTIAQAKVSTNGYEALDLGYLTEFNDQIIRHEISRVSLAKKNMLALLDKGFIASSTVQNIPVLGKPFLALCEVGIESMLEAGYATQHDAKVANKLAYVMSGGALSETTFVSEQYLLNLEKEAFLSLCGEKKTLERMKAVLTTGKPIRN